MISASALKEKHQRVVSGASILVVGPLLEIKLLLAISINLHSFGRFAMLQTS